MCSFQFFIYTLHILIKGYPIMGFKGPNSRITCTCMMFLNYILTCDIEHNSLKMMFLTISVLHPLSFSKTVLIGKDWSVIFLTLLYISDHVLLSITCIPANVLSHFLKIERKTLQLHATRSCLYLHMYQCFKIK